MCKATTTFLLLNQAKLVNVEPVGQYLWAIQSQKQESWNDQNNQTKRNIDNIIQERWVQNPVIVAVQRKMGPSLKKIKNIYKKKKNILKNGDDMEIY